MKPEAATIDFSRFVTKSCQHIFGPANRHFCQVGVASLSGGRRSSQPDIPAIAKLSQAAVFICSTPENSIVPSSTFPYRNVTRSSA